MQKIFTDLKKNYPKAHKLLTFGLSPQLDEVKNLGLPNDYYELYNLISHENETSNGVFGLYRLLPAGLTHAITNPEWLYWERDKTASIFIPIFQNGGGREQYGYAKIEGEWIFCLFGLGIEFTETTLTDFLIEFHDNIINKRYCETDDFIGLIHESEMDDEDEDEDEDYT